MGWNLCIASEREREAASALRRLGDRASEDDYDALYESVTSLSRRFSYELLEDYGQLRRGLTEDEAAALRPDDIEDPERWRARDAKRVLAILRGVRERLERESDRMPLGHVLWYVDEDGRRWNGTTQITLPFVTTPTAYLGGIELKVPHDPMVKLDGGHDVPGHRHELRRYNVRVDPVLLARLNRALEERGSELDPDTPRAVVFGPFGFGLQSPLVEEPAGWVPVQPVLHVLGCRVEVESIDARASLSPDLHRAIERCEQAARTGEALYWLMK